MTLLLKRDRSDITENTLTADAAAQQGIPAVVEEIPAVASAVVEKKKAKVATGGSESTGKPEVSQKPTKMKVKAGSEGKKSKNSASKTVTENSATDENIAAPATVEMLTQRKTQARNAFFNGNGITADTTKPQPAPRTKTVATSNSEDLSAAVPKITVTSSPPGGGNVNENLQQNVGATGPSFEPFSCEVEKP